MARLPIPVTTLLTDYPGRPLTASSADIVWTASGADFADGASFPMTGKEILLVLGGAGVETITITSVVDQYNRLGTITTYSIGIGEYVVFPFLNAVHGWAQANGLLYFATTDTDVSFAVLRLGRS